MAKRKNQSRLLSRINLWQLTVFILALLPLIFLVIILRKYSVNVPFYDQWELVDLYRKSHSGLLGFADFFAQHNEHRLLFPRMVWYPIARVTNWNTNFEIFVNIILAASAFMLLSQIIRKTFSSAGKYAATGIIVSSLIFFSPLQWENWMWGWQNQWFMNVLGVVLAVWALTTYETPKLHRKFIIAGAGAILATYSLGSGMFAWFIAIPLIYMDKKQKRYLKYWMIVGALTIASHYIGYVDPSYHPSKTIFLKQPTEFIKYFMTYVARPITIDFLLATFFAICLLVSGLIAVAYLYKFYKKELTINLLPWICFGLYGFMAAGSTAISRLGFGIEQGYANRYVTLSNFILISLVMVLIKIIQVSDRTLALQKIVSAGSIVALSMVVILVSLNYIRGVEQMKNQSKYLMQARTCAVLTQDPNDDCLLKLYPNKAVLWNRLQYLRSIHWGGI
jgi:hypothetical protein